MDVSWHIVVSVILKNGINNLMFIMTWNVINPFIQVEQKYNGSNNQKVHIIQTYDESYFEIGK